MRGYLDNCPCYPCLLRTPLKATKCNPAECQELTDWIDLLVKASVVITTVKRALVLCTLCGSPRTVKAGFTGAGELSGGSQLYKCKNCKRRFRPGHKTRMNTRQEIIDYALNLAKQQNPAFSTRDISRRILINFDVCVSHVSVAQWLLR